MKQPMPINSKAERDAVRRRAGGNGKVVAEARRLVGEWRAGRAAAACMEDLARALARKDGR